MSPELSFRNLAVRAGLQPDDLPAVLGMEQRDLTALASGWGRISDGSLHNAVERLRARGRPVPAQLVADTLRAASESRTDHPPYWLATLGDEIATLVADHKDMPKSAMEARIMRRFPRSHGELLQDGLFHVTGWVVDIAPMEHAADRG